MAGNYQIHSLLAKVKDVDQDLRFMALSDLSNELSKPYTQLDDTTEVAVVNQVLEAMNDPNTEVKNVAVKFLGNLVKIVQEPHMITIIERLTAYSSSEDEHLRDISNLALRTVIRELSPVSPMGRSSGLRLIPKLISQINSPKSSEDLIIGDLELLSDLLYRFDTTVTKNILQDALPVFQSLLTHNRAAIRKRAAEVLGVWASLAPDDLFDQFEKTILYPFLDFDAEKLKTGITLVGSLVNRAPQKSGKLLKTLVPKILKAANDDDEELNEAILLTLERVLLKCPKEATPFHEGIIEVASAYIKYDPNYAELPEDDEMADDEEDADDEFEDEYSDEEDVSWKVRRSATKVFSAMFDSKPDGVPQFQKSIPPVLISRFSEREETVKLEVWNAFTKYLKFVHAFTEGGSGGDGGESPTRLKRKRSVEIMDVDESPIDSLHSQAPTIVLSISKQLGAKTNSVRESGFALLHALVTVLPGALESHMDFVSPRISSALTSADGSIGSGSATNLKLEVLSFLSAIFRTHPPISYEQYLPDLIPSLTKCIDDPYNKVASQAFKACSSFVNAVRPSFVQVDGNVIIGERDFYSTAIKEVHQTTANRLESQNADQEVKECGISCLGDIFSNVGNAVEYQKSLPLMRDLLRRETTRIATLNNIIKISKSPTLPEEALNEWLRSILVEIAGYLRHSNRALRHSVFTCLPYVTELAGPSAKFSDLEETLNFIEPYVSDSDLHLTPLALQTLQSIITANSTILQSSRFQEGIMPKVYELVYSPLLNSSTLEAMLAFFKSLVTAKTDPAKIIYSLSSIKRSESSDITVSEEPVAPVRPSYANAAKSIGMVAKIEPSVIESTSRQLLDEIKSPDASSEVVGFDLMILGELGRLPEFSSSEDYFLFSYQFFESPSIDVRTAAAFAVGNIAVGNPERLLKTLVQNVNKESAPVEKSRELSLLSLKEFITHSSQTKLADVGNSLWDTLLHVCAIEGQPGSNSLSADRASQSNAPSREAEEAKNAWKQSEVIRNVAAECLGKITLVDPSKYLTKLQSKINDPLSGIRSAVILTIRYAIAGESPSLEETLGPLVPQFLSLIDDSDLDVRKAALSTFNSAAHHKPQLVRNHLGILLPSLYSQTVVNENLIRVVEMGPFKHKVDDGLECRKAAFECMYSLLDACPHKIDGHEFLNRVLFGITDENEIRAICYLMLVRLAQITPNAVTLRLDDASDVLLATLNEKLKDNAVKQEQESHLQMQKSALRAFRGMSKLASPSNAPKFMAAISQVKSNPQWRSEYEELGRNGGDRGLGNKMEID